ncbi:hypothetical protein F5050DRAFT_1316896 [Lentinula boryana]|uniref:Uncharacterized protein n=1 Tax=Lentinula boryana TaxID=40481 RepID=A0ABQ8PXI4_9AGAR|nr:hypothetical protein F5050DRAFT_1316896 [Lentinula boryana]
MLFSISYVLLGLVAVIHAIPVNTAPLHPPHAVSLLDPRHPQPLPQDEINVLFVFPERTGTGCPVRIIKQEINLILEEYRQHINVNKPFRFSLLNRYDGDIKNNFHDFIFWGEGMSGDCQTQENPCRVQYVALWQLLREPRPTTRLLTISNHITNDVLDLTYALRNKLKGSVHPVSDEILAPVSFFFLVIYYLIDIEIVIILALARHSTVKITM